MTASINLNIYDGSRQPITAGTQLLITVRDGFEDELLRRYEPGPNVLITDLPIHDNSADGHTVLAWSEGYRQAGFYPVPISLQSSVTLRLMLVKSDATFNFANARWNDVKREKPALAQILGDAESTYNDLIESGPDKLACLLNISTAMEQIFLPQGTPLTYVKQIILDDLRPDRFFCWVDPQLVDQLTEASQHGEFDQQPELDLPLHSSDLYGPATSSFKQLQFGEANVQLTFHSQTTKGIAGVDCLLLEPDIDYYKDPLAHVLLEVLPHAVTGSLTDPKIVYVLRWIAGQRAGIPEFNPLYTLV